MEGFARQLGKLGAKVCTRRRKGVAWALGLALTGHYLGRLIFGTFDTSQEAASMHCRQAAVEL